MANGIRQQILDLDKEHLRRTTEERAAHKANVEDFAEKLERSNAELDSASRKVNETAVDHLAAVNRVKALEDERNREHNAMHMENVKETRKANARELDSLRNAGETNEKNLIEYQSAEKQRAEEARRQLNKESTERIALEMQETSRTRELAEQQEKERIQYRHHVEQNNLEDVKEMKMVLQQSIERENARRIQHAENLDSISRFDVVSRLKMENAQQLMVKRREASDVMEQADKTLNTIHNKFMNLSGILGVALRLKNADILRKNFVMISNNLEVIKTSRESALRILDNLLSLEIDEKDQERKLVVYEVMEELRKLNTFYSVLTELMPRAQDQVPNSHFVEIERAFNEASEVIEAIKSYWRNVPEIDSTNLIHQQFLETTGALLNRGDLAVQIEELKALEAAHQ